MHALTQVERSEIAYDDFRDELCAFMQQWRGDGVDAGADAVTLDEALAFVRHSQ